MKVILIISILISLFAINSGHIILPGLLGIKALKLKVSSYALDQMTDYIMKTTVVVPPS